MGNFSFTCELFELPVEVTATVYKGELPSLDCPGEPGGVEIETVTHRGIELDLNNVYIHNSFGSNSVFNILQIKAEEAIADQRYQEEPFYLKEDEQWSN